ncbi:MAG: AzlD domain-containing protein [Haloferacaceae archaeon]
MAGEAVDGGLLWTLIALVGAGTFALRLSFLQLRGLVDEFPPALERPLSYLPVAVLAAIVFPALFTLDGTPGGVINVRVFAASLAVVVAWRTRSVVATIVVGMGVLWTATFLFG